MDDDQASSFKAVEERVAKQISNLKVQQDALQRQVVEARASIRDKSQLNAIKKQMGKHGKEALDEDAKLPCLLCGEPDCLLCDWCGEACSGQGRDRNKCTGATTYEKGDTCFRCYKPKNSKMFQPPTDAHRHKPNKCKACPRRI